MRLRRFVSFSVVALIALASIGATAITASGKDRGKSEAAHENHPPKKAASGPSDSKHDPSNPDGTYRGKSSSTPDQDGIGADHGIVNNDKTGPGTDGNNGCGNDADREDDNNGKCGRQTVTPSPTVAPTETSGGEAEVLGETLKRPTSVLGVSFARTGAAVMMLSFLAIVLIAMGFALRTIAKPRRSE